MHFAATHANMDFAYMFHITGLHLDRVKTTVWLANAII